MGGDLSVLRGRTPDELAEDAAVRQLLRSCANGDSSLIRSVRTSTSGACALRKLELDCAALLQHWKLVARKASYGFVDSSDSSPQTSHPSNVLLRHMLDAQNNKGETALSVAAQLGHVEAVQFLLEQGANPWLTDRFGGRTALHTACLNAKHLVVKVLLEQLPSQWRTNPVDGRMRYVNCTTVSGFTPLHCAAASSDGRTLKAVLAHNPSLTAYNNFDSYEYGMEFPARSTAMHVAAFKGSMLIAKELLRHYHTQQAGYRQRATPDLRLARNSHDDLPWQVAYNMHIRTLAELLHPSVPLATFFPEQQGCSLQALASAALQQRLLRSLDKAQQLQQPQPASEPRECPARSQTTLLPAPPLMPSCGGTPDSCSTSGGMHGPMSCDTHCSKSAGCGREDLHDALGDMHMEDVTAGMLAEGCHASPSTSPPTSHVSAGWRMMRNAVSDSGCQQAGKGTMPARDGLCSLTLPGHAPQHLNRPQQPAPAPHAASSPHSSSSEEAAADEGEYGGLLSRQVSMCNICMDMEARMELAPCTHRLCEGCARQIVQNMKIKPVDCPFCRRHIAGFTVAR